jgi:hypothetical protein
MAILAFLWTWVRGHSPTQIFHAACILGIAIFACWGIVHERNIGFKECEDAHAKADARAQAAADEAAKANEKLRVKVDELSQQLPSYLQIYQDKSKPSDCPDVPYKRKLKP